jgi:hypothetical protein
MNDIEFTKKDLTQIREHGLSTELIIQQRDMIKKGFPPIDLVAPATLGDGIISYDDADMDMHIAEFETYIANRKLLKFVPASGVASRMFKELLALKNEGFSEEEIHAAVSRETDIHSIFSFFKHFQDFAFFNDFNKLLKKKGLDLKELNYKELLEYFFEEKGLNYAETPKALITFHAYEDHSRTALEEHLVEGALYAKNSDNSCHIHFTLSPEHIEKTQLLLKNILPVYEKKFNVKYHIDHSIQDPSSDTIALGTDNQLFRNNDSTLLFRPGGHGALLENLNNLDADIVFIKNIDNIVPDHFKKESIRYKKLLAIQLILIQDQIFDYLKRLDANEVSPAFANEILNFCSKQLCIKFPEDFRELELIEQLDMLFELLNRPLRVCGMVKNEGEPGGGPYWVRNNNDFISLQIVEASQINLNDPEQSRIMKNASHFNPVDLVCTFKDFRGNTFDLKEFTDPDTGFIAAKSSEGRELKTLEHPGLWNGAMADWNTVFIEVPLSTFNPVKTINDLLRKEHMNQK